MLGILGGMGPLASAEFLRTIYRLSIAGPEQEAPSCFLLSDPTFPDRTDAILQGSTEILAERLASALEKLSNLGAERIVIACVTVHHVLPRIPEHLRRRVVSLIDLVVDEVSTTREPHLLLATTGTRRARIFESHERWSSIADRVRLPDDDDQRNLHEWIYRLKQNEPAADCLVWLDSLARRAGTDRLIFGCTELHLLQEPLAVRNGSVHGPRIVDPLLSVARSLCPALPSA